jgi:hypothetical protein
MGTIFAISTLLLALLWGFHIYARWRHRPKENTRSASLHRPMRGYEESIVLKKRQQESSRHICRPAAPATRHLSEPGTARSRTMAIVVVSGLAITNLLAAQQPTPGEKTRPSGKGATYNEPGATYTGDQKQLAKPRKATAVVKDIDLKKRLILLEPVKKNQSFRVADVDDSGRRWYTVDELDLGFVTPEGQERIQVSKKVARSMGKKEILLEELKPSAKVRVEYYPVLRRILTIRVEELP